MKQQFPAFGTSFFAIQKKVGIILFFLTLITAILNFINNLLSIHSTSLQAFTDITVLPTLIASFLLLVTGLRDSVILRCAQVSIVFLAGFFTVLVTTPGNLTGVIFLLFGMALAYQYGFFASRFHIKLIPLLVVYLLATFGNVFIINKTQLPFGIPSVLFSLTTMYLYWLVFSEKIKRYLIRTNQMKWRLHRTISENERLEHITADQARLIKEKNRSLEKNLEGKEAVERELRSTLNVKNILLKEIHHRVKNNLAVIISLFNLQHSDNPVIQGFITVNSTRLHAMAAVHETVYQNEDAQSSISLGAYLSDIMDNLVKIYSGEDTITVQLDTEDIEVSIDTAVALGIILNDCVSNSIVYGLTGKPSGKTLSITIKKDSGITMIISDNGAPITPELYSSSHDLAFSIKLIKLLVEDQLRGSLTREYDNGNQWIIQVPE